MHSSGGRLYGGTIIGQQEYGFVDWLQGVKASTHRPGLTFWGSEENVGYTWSKCFQASPSKEWYNTSSSYNFHSSTSYALHIFPKHILLECEGLKASNAISFEEHLKSFTYAYT